MGSVSWYRMWLKISLYEHCERFLREVLPGGFVVKYWIGVQSVLGLNPTTSWLRLKAKSIKE